MRTSTKTSFALSCIYLLATIMIYSYGVSPLLVPSTWLSYAGTPQDLQFAALVIAFVSTIVALITEEPASRTRYFYVLGLGSLLAVLAVVGSAVILTTNAGPQVHILPVALYLGQLPALLYLGVVDGLFFKFLRPA